jgi:hypothetical protein
MNHRDVIIWLCALKHRAQVIYHRQVTCRERCHPRGISVQRREILFRRRIYPQTMSRIFQTDSNCRGICPKCERLAVWHQTDVDVQWPQNPFKRGLKTPEEYNESEGEEWKS